MTESDLQAVFARLAQLRLELVDLAFTLECRGRLDAADVAMTTSARVAELCEELTKAGPPPLPTPD